MRVVVFGASGGCGRHAVAIAREQGHHVTAVVRAVTAYEPPPGVTVVRADVTDESAFDVVAGADAVLNCLGMKRVNPANPWSPLTCPPDFNSATARSLIAAMTRHRVARVVAISAAGVGDSAARMNGLMRFLVATSNVGVAYRDLALAEQRYATSALHWCAVRPTRLTNGPRTDRVHIVDGFPLRAAISRADVAAWMVKSLVTDGASSPTPIITSA